MSEADPVLASFLEAAMRDAARIAGASDVLAVVPLAPLPARTYRCVFDVRYLRRLPSGLVDVAPGPVVAAIHFPDDYLRALDRQLGLRVVSMLTPDVFHPNVRGAAVCLGSAFAPGTPIRWLLAELYEVITYRNLTVDERNALDPEACRFLRQQPALLGRLGDPPPLRRHRRRLRVKAVAR